MILHKSVTMCDGLNYYKNLPTTSGLTRARLVESTHPAVEHSRLKYLRRVAQSAVFNRVWRIYRISRCGRAGSRLSRLCFYHSQEVAFSMYRFTFIINLRRSKIDGLVAYRATDF
jgi:hypothetical protein